MQNATLVWKSHPHQRRDIVVFDNTIYADAAKLVHRIFNPPHNRLKIKNNRYFYQPSNEYKKFVVRFRKIK